MNLEELVGTVSDRFKVNEEHRKLGLDFLTSRLEWFSAHRSYHQIMHSIMMDELQLYYYLCGAIPIKTTEGLKTLNSREDLSLLRPSKIGVQSAENRFDNELFKLYRRVSWRSGKGLYLSWGKLIDQIGNDPFVRKHFKRQITYDDVVPPEIALARYMAGEVEISWRSGRRKIINSEKDLPLLSINSITKRGDLRLLRLYRRVEDDRVKKGGPNWIELVNRAGRMRNAVANLGSIVVGGDVTGKYTPQEHFELIRYKARTMPLQGEEGRPTVEDILNLHVFSDAYRNSQTHLAKNKETSLLHEVFRRLAQLSFKKRAQTPRQAVDMVFRMPELVAKYGRVFTARQLDMIAGLKRYTDRFESYLAGGVPIRVSGVKKTIDSVAEMRLFISFSRSFHVRELQSIRTGITGRYLEIGLTYYDIFDIAGARPSVVKKYGRPVSRSDANPNLAKAPATA